MKFNIIDIIVLLAGAQGLFLTLLLYQKRRLLYANRFLIILILGYSVNMIYLFFWEVGFMKEHPHWMLIPLGFPFLISPLHYLYAKYLFNVSHRFNKIEIFHFLPFSLFILGAIPLFFISRDRIVVFLSGVEYGGFPLVFVIFNWLLIIQLAIYLFLVLKLLSRYSHYIKGIFSSIEKIRLNWLRNITILAIITASIFIMENILILMGINLSDYFNLSSLLMALYVYLLGYLGLLKSEIYGSSQIITLMTTFPGGELSHKCNLKLKNKYQKSGLGKEKAEQILDDLLSIMTTEKIYTNSDLTLSQLADKLSVSPHNLSEVINTQLRQNFFDFINQYRVEQVKKDLVHSEKLHYKLLAIAYDAGFNSKTAFNTIFKKVTGSTPSEFRDKNISR
jgi:AraC-like DNA-binding protein